MVTRKDGITRNEKCPDCGAAVILRFEHTADAYNQLVLYDLNGNRHNCEPKVEYEDHPIGKTVVGKMVERFQLRGRRLTITLADGNVLTVSAKGIPLSLQLQGPAGIMQE